MIMASQNGVAVKVMAIGMVMAMEEVIAGETNNII